MARRGRVRRREKAMRRREGEKVWVNWMVGREDRDMIRGSLVSSALGISFRGDQIGKT
jgi:hypothetical protein